MRHPRRTPAPLILMASLAVGACGLTASAQGTAPGFPWGWAPAAPQHTGWSAEAVADYLFTGHAPHQAVARIVAPEHGGTSLGSGVLVDMNRTQGLVLTNWHVIRDSRSAVLVQFPDGFQSAGTVVRWDEAWDLAAIVVWKPRATPVAIAERPPAVGERLTIAGFGRGSYREETGECTEYLSPGTGYAKEFVELRATARQGDSGGPIFNESRELAGVLFGQNDGRTIGSCSTRVRAFLASVGSRGFVPTPIAEFSDALAVDRGIGAAVPPDVRMADAVTDTSVQRSTHVAAPVPPLAGLASQPVASPSAGMPSRTGAVRDLVDPFHNGAALLHTAGGLALVAVGMRTLFGSRRPQRVSGPSASW